MKQIIILLCTLTILFTFGVLELNYLDTTSNYVVADLTHTRNCVINQEYNLAKSHIKQVESTWGEMKKVWDMLVDHSDIDKIEDAIGSFKVYVDNEEKTEAFAQYEILVRTFRHIAASKKICIQNII